MKNEITWKRESGYKTKREGLHENYVEYFSSHKDFIIIFDSGHDLVECFEKNFSFTGGSGAYRNTLSVTANRTRENSWTFGSDATTHDKTAEYLHAGAMPMKYLDLYEKTVFELYQRFPELNDLNAVAISKKRRKCHSDDGDELDIDRYMTGDPCMFVKKTRSNVVKRCIKLYVEIGVSVGTSTETIVKNVIYAIALTDIIERAGISVEMYFGAITVPARENIYSIGVMCKAKAADEPIDTARLLSFALPGFYRQFVFGIWNNCFAGVNGTMSSCHSGFEFGRYPHVGEALTLLNPEIKMHCASHHLREQDISLVINEIKKCFDGTAAQGLNESEHEDMDILNDYR